MSRKIYWHELTDEQRLDTWEKGGLKVHEFMEKYSQPDWCQECFAEMPSIDTESAIELWNTRPIEDALQARIAELEEERRWIPVEERLPEDKFEHVLVCTTYGVSVRLALEIGEAVTHWMPLPNLPEVNNE